MTLVFWASALLVVFAYAGYPALMFLYAQLRPKPIAKAPWLPTVTAVMSVYNGEAVVGSKLENLLALDYPAALFDIIVICDGCTDGTAEACRRFGERVTVLESQERRGKARGLDDAVAAATGEILLMTDVRQRIELPALRELVENFSDDGIGAVSGELRFEKAEGDFGGSVDAYWHYEKAIRLAESKTGSVVGVTGAFYAIRRSLYEPLPPGTVLDDVLIPMRVVKQGFRVVMDAYAVAWDQPSRSEGQERSRKIRTLAGNYQLVALAPWLLDPFTNPIWFRFASHKLLRLAAPWLIVLILLATILLAPRHPFYVLCLVAAITCAGLVWGGQRLPALRRSLPVKLLNAFWYMNLYSAQALIAYLRNPRLHLW